MKELLNPEASQRLKETPSAFGGQPMAPAQAAPIRQAIMWYDAEYYERSPKADPRCDDGDRRTKVLRGGSWSHYAKLCRAAYRVWSEPDNRNNYTGFRVVCPEPKPG